MRGRARGAPERRRRRECHGERQFDGTERRGDVASELERVPHAGEELESDLVRAEPPEVVRKLVDGKSPSRGTRIEHEREGLDADVRDEEALAVARRPQRDPGLRPTSEFTSASANGWPSRRSRTRSTMNAAGSRSRADLRPAVEPTRSEHVHCSIGGRKAAVISSRASSSSASQADQCRLPSSHRGARAHDRRPEPGAARTAVPARAFPAAAGADARPHRRHSGAVRAVVLHRPVEPARGIPARRSHQGARASECRSRHAPALDHPPRLGRRLLAVRRRNAGRAAGGLAPLRQEAARGRT